MANKPYSILDRVVNIEPSGVIYNIKGSQIEEFVMNYLNTKNVTGVSAVRVIVDGDGNNSKVRAYVFMSPNSNMVQSQGMNNIPEILRGQIETEMRMNIKEEFKRILAPLCGQNIDSGKAPQSRDYYIKLNIFRVLGMMFMADVSRHRINIPQSARIPNNNDCLLSVTKYEKFDGGGNANRNSGDNYARQISEIEKRHW